MKQVVIENPILNSPFDMPNRHFKFDEFGITDEIAKVTPAEQLFHPDCQPAQGDQASHV